MIRCLITDDELIAHQILEQYILQTEGLTLVAKCRNALEALAVLERQTIDLMFLDIEMPLINGVNFLKTLTAPPKVVFTTAYADYALQGYELNVVDYLLKPFSYERFCQAVNKVKAAIPALAAGQKENAPDFLVVKEKEGFIRIPYEEILCIEGSRDYVRIITQVKQYLVHLTMKKLEEELPANRFVRAHKSYIVALAKIKVMKNDELLLSTNRAIPVSANYREQVMKRFSKKV